MLTVLYVIGILAEAMTGALAAGRQRMDLFGVMMIAGVTAFGGGTVRDVLLGHYPLRWVAEPVFLAMVLIAALITVLSSFLMDYFRTLFLILDALGLAAFAVLGAQVALSSGHGPFIAVVAAVLTGICGGVLRDILCDRVPLVFHDELYASVAMITAVVYVGLIETDLPADFAALVSVIVCFVTRLLAIYYRISLPVFEYQEHEVVRDPAGRFTHWMLNKAGIRRRHARTLVVGNAKARRAAERGQQCEAVDTERDTRRDVEGNE